MILVFGGFVGWIPEFLNLWVQRVHTIQIIIRHYFFKLFFFCTSANFLSTRPLEIATKLTHILVFVCRAWFAPFLFSAFFWTTAVIIHSCSLSLSLSLSLSFCYLVKESPSTTFFILVVLLFSSRSLVFLVFIVSISLLFHFILSVYSYVYKTSF